MLGIGFDVSGAGELEDFFISYTAGALGSMVIGAGFSISTIVYEFDRLALWLKIIINVLVGFGIFFLVAFRIGLIAVLAPSWVIAIVIFNIIVFIAISVGYYLLSAREARSINEKLKELETEN